MLRDLLLTSPRTIHKSGTDAQAKKKKSKNSDLGKPLPHNLSKLEEQDEQEFEEEKEIAKPTNILRKPIPNQNPILTKSSNLSIEDSGSQLTKAKPIPDMIRANPEDLYSSIEEEDAPRVRESGDFKAKRKSHSQRKKKT